MRIFIKPGNFKILQAKKNLKQSDLAEVIGITAVHMCNVSNGKAPVSPDVRKKIISIFPGLPWERLFRIEEE